MDIIRLSGIAQDSIVDGPGLRFTVFTQGCPHRCPGCHNPDTHNFEGGYDENVETLTEKLRGNPLLDGLTLSGGEPFAQPGACAQLAQSAREMGLTVWTYTGYTFAQLMQMQDADVRRLLEATDVLVDGPFILEQRSLGLKFKGSANQRILDVKRSMSDGVAVELEQ